MIALIILVCFAAPSFAESNSTALEGWQVDGDSRSSWDILWTCLSTILACTWTALHPSVPKRDESESNLILWKIMGFIGAVLAPELMAGMAAEEFCHARAIVARCNAAFCKLSIESMKSKPSSIKTREGEGEDPSAEEASPDKDTTIQENDASTGEEEASAPKERPSTHDDDVSTEDKVVSTTPRWSVAHGYCLAMNGVLLQTKDRWTYPVQTNNVVPLIEAGILQPGHVRSRDIKDRAKADSFGKAFTLLQSLWVTTNIVARRAYDLPISPLEYSTVAYVACAAVTYCTWWHKPRDMTTPIIVFLPYDKDGTDMPPLIRKTLEEGHGSWVRLPKPSVEEPHSASTNPLKWPGIAVRIVCMPFTPERRKKLYTISKKSYEDQKEDLADEDPPPSSGNQDEGTVHSASQEIETQKSTRKARNPVERLRIMSYISLTHFYMFIALLFCGIHVAA
ncbi:hypothetical protein N7466_000841 [Penicillium verhagenii]|uniref:uncharacterized protein n=1 Tax=Penicillium verhagenii TaxID=1562060 RepID=UPI0025452795|nr:uncharacterized protein N7466_000841 [Penicillium verhagenii]KAJ5947826.1 hypothetical protein N7466_000841 [Penicillium verhagenii]